jgi:hypothetical protein
LQRDRRRGGRQLRSRSRDATTRYGPSLCRQGLTERKQRILRRKRYVGVRSRGAHSVEEEHVILHALGACRGGSRGLALGAAGGCLGCVVVGLRRGLLAGAPCETLGVIRSGGVDNGPDKSCTRSEIWAMGAKDVKRGLEGVEGGELWSWVSGVLRWDVVEMLTRRLDRTVYKSGDWYMRLFMMKYAARGRTDPSCSVNGRRECTTATYLLPGTASPACE